MRSWNEEPRVSIASASLGDRWPEALYQHYLQSVPVAFHAKVNAYRNWQDRQRSLIGRLLLASLLHRYGFPVGTLEQLAIGRYGKPFIDSGFHFNIAHSADRIVCVASRDVAVGIDIEFIRPIDFSDFESVMSPTQWQRITESEDPILEFWRHWTVKEAIAKADGRGIGLPLATISIESAVAVLGENRWHVAELEQWKGYCSFVAGNQPIEPGLIAFETYQFG